MPMFVSRAVRLGLSLLLVSLLVTVGVAPAAGSPAVRITTGVYIPGAAQQLELLDEFEAMVGQPAGIVQWYQPWGADYSHGAAYQPVLDVDALENVSERGAIPLITWEAWGTVNGANPSRVRTIPTGVFDDYIDRWAEGLRDFGGLVYLRLFHELNNSAYPWAYGNHGNTAEDLIAAWRYVHDRFTAAGATNVEWVWAPSTENALVPFSDIYPGDDYVDWLGVDGYNGGDIYYDWWGGWVTPYQVFANSMESFKQINMLKPVMIVETSSVEQGGDKADWITDLYLELPKRFPQIRAILWFNADWGEDERANWLVDSSPESLDAYRESVETLANEPPLLGRIQRALSLFRPY